MTTLTIIAVCITVFFCAVTWCSTWRAVRFKMSEDWLAAQREGYAAARNSTRDAAKIMQQHMTTDEE